ncbi:hypothetical protein GCM10010532_032120 [Dactylosporangium siamense]|uniref:Uncharacterized protein n=1 Tax=Dactylosporangium siamense TaxID=685454 RepID=A0A919PGN1_9ACTN|nr:hypothetical protein Dsi01nite_018780 [Dactylosporangium siamense]
MAAACEAATGGGALDGKWRRRARRFPATAREAASGSPPTHSDRCGRRDPVPPAAPANHSCYAASGCGAHPQPDPSDSVAGELSLPPCPARGYFKDCIQSRNSRA